MPFCKETLYDYICVPVRLNFWESWTLRTKDELIEKEIAKMTEERLLAELSNSFFSAERTSVSGMELTSHTKSLKAFKTFQCRLNFPLCNPEEQGKTYKVCRADCFES